MAIETETRGSGARLAAQSGGRMDPRATLREAECRRRGWLCKPVPGQGPMPCDASDPEAQPDLGRLYIEAAWERVLRGWVPEA